VGPRRRAHEAVRLAAALRQLGSQFSANGPERRQAEAAAAIAERSTRTLDRLGAGHRPAREPTRLAVLGEEVVRSHDPEQRRVRRQVASVVINLDAVRVERIMDRLVVLALGNAVPGTGVTLTGAPITDGVQLNVSYEGRDARDGLRTTLGGKQETTDWTVLTQLVEDLHGTIEVASDGTSVTVRLPRNHGL